MENLAFNDRVNKINVFGTYNHTLGYTATAIATIPHTTVEESLDAYSVVTDENLYRTLNDINIDLNGLKIDYVTRLWSGQLETGT